MPDAACQQYGVPVRECAKTLPHTGTDTAIAEFGGALLIGGLFLAILTRAIKW